MSRGIVAGLMLFCLLAAVVTVFSSCSRKPKVQRVIAVLPVDAHPGEYPPIERDSVEDNRRRERHDWVVNHAMPIREAVNSGLLEHKNKSKFRVVDTNHIDRIVDQHRFEASAWSDSAKVTEIGRALNADIIVITTVTHNGVVTINASSWKVNVAVTVLDINTMELLGKSNVELKGNFMSNSLSISLKPVEKAVKKIKLSI